MNAFFKYLLSFLLLASGPLSGQSTKTDSLLDLLKSHPADTVRANALNQLALLFRPRSPKQSKAYSNEALRLSQQLNYEKGKGYALTMLGIYDKKDGENKSAIKKYDLAINHFKKAGHVPGLLFALLEMAVVQKSEGDFDASFHCYEIMDSLSAATNDTTYMIEALNGYANIYRYRDNYAQSLQYYIRSIQLANAADEKLLEAISLTNMAIIYSYQHKTDDELKVVSRAAMLIETVKDTVRLITLYSYLGNIYTDKKEYEKARQAYTRAKVTAEKFGYERAGYHAVSEIYMNFAELSSRTGQLEEAAEYFRTSLNWAIRSNDKKSISSAWGSLAAALLRIKDLAEAEKAAKQQMLLAEEMRYKRGRMQAADLLAEIFSQRGEYKSAFLWHRQYALLKDSLLNEEGLKQMTEMQTKYETEKKDKELILKDAEITKQNAINKQQETERNALIAGCSFLLVLAFIIFRNFRQKKLAHQLLEDKNRIILEQKAFVEEKQKETLDSIHYAKRIQRSLLPTEKYIEKSLKRLLK